jgi:membrane-associated phospholipid phosphatase
MKRKVMYACFVLAGVVAVCVSQRLFVSFDRQAFTTWEVNGSWQHLLIIFTVPATILWLVLLCCFVPLFRSPTMRWRVIIAFVVLECLEVLGKAVFVQPAGDLKETVVHLHFLYSFPSGHAMRAAFVLALLASVLPKKAHPLILLVLGLVAWGLVASGAHYPSDVLGGILLGLGAGIGVNLRKSSNL